MTHKEALQKIGAVLKRSVFGKQKFESGKLSDGTEIEYSALEPDAEISIKDAEGNPTPAPVGEYELEDGRIVIVTEAGKIAEIKDAAPSEGEEKAAKKDEKKKSEEMAEEGDGKTPPKSGIDWSQQVEDMKRQLAWQAERIASLVTAMQMFKADASAVFATFHDYLQADASSGGKAITKPGQSVFSEAKQGKEEAKGRYLSALQNFNKRQKEGAGK